MAQAPGLEANGRSGSDSMGASYDPHAFAIKIALDKYMARANGSGGTKGSGTSASGTFSMPTEIQYGALINAQRAQLMSGQQLADLYGITYKRDDIEKIFQNATKAEFDAKNAAYKRSSRDYYMRLATAQDTGLDTMRKLQAIQSGANAGMQNANALSAVLGIQQSAAPDALELTQQFRALQDEYTAAVAANTKESLEYANSVSQALGALAATIYGVDAQQYAAELGYNAQVQSANTAASAQGYAADKNLEGVKYTANMNLEAAKAAAAGNVAAVKLQMANALAQNNMALYAQIYASAIANSTPQEAAEYLDYFMSSIGYA